VYIPGRTKEPLKKRNKSTWDINQVRQPCRGSGPARL
jgi:hypothetical protein